MKQYFRVFIRIIITEIIKLKGTFTLWLTLLYPLGTVLLVSLLWINQRNSKVVNTDQFINNLGNTASFFLPFFIVLIISVAWNTEHKSSMLKHLLALPVPRPQLYLGKFTGIMAFIALAFILTVAMTYFSLLVFGMINPKLGFGMHFNHGLLFLILVKAYIAAAAIYSIQYWLGMRLRNLTLPLAIGSTLIILPIAILIILGIAGLINRNVEFLKIITYNPYSYPYSPGFNFIQKSEIVVFTTNSLVFIFLSVTVLAFGAWDFNRRNVV